MLKLIAPAVSLPPVQKTQERGTQSFVSESEVKTVKGPATRLGPRPTTKTQDTFSLLGGAGLQPCDNGQE